MNYSEQLRDPRWQKKRLQILERDGFACVTCGDTKSTLHVHHIKYGKRSSPWEVPAEWLKTLCEGCHERVTEATNKVAESVRAMTPDQAEALAKSITPGSTAAGPFATPAASALSDGMIAGIIAAHRTSRAHFDINGRR